MTRVLLIEDDPRIAAFLMQGLTVEGHAVLHAATGAEGLELVRQAQADGGSGVVVLDVMLPDLHGLDLCRTLRRQGVTLPILMLSALGDSHDRISGLRMGADDYLAKPFDFDELLARIEALTRRSAASYRPRDAVIRLGALAFDTERMIVTRDGREIALTAQELAMLHCFVSAPGRLFTRERLLAEVWRTDRDPLTNIVDVYVGRLRRKLGKGPDLPEIRTLRGMGYRLTAPGGPDYSGA